MTKFLNGECRECGGQFEFPADAVETSTACPHCGKPTELLLATPPRESAIPLRTIVYTCISILILVAGLVAAIIALKRAELERAERMTGRNSATPTAVPQPPAAPTPPANK